MAARNYTSILDAKSLALTMNASVTTMQLNNLTGIPSYPFTMVIEPDTANEEIVTVASLNAGTNAARYLLALYTQRLDEESRKLRDRYPIRVHYTR